jgi:hypothetical protein
VDGDPTITADREARTLEDVLRRFPEPRRRKRRRPLHLDLGRSPEVHPAYHYKASNNGAE